MTTLSGESAQGYLPDPRNEQVLVYVNGEFLPRHQARISVFANVGGKADIAFMLLAAELGTLGQMHRDIEHLFPPGVLQTVYSYLSVTELSEYTSTEDDHRKQLERENVVPDSMGVAARNCSSGSAPL